MTIKTGDKATIWEETGSLFNRVERKIQEQFEKSRAIRSRNTEEEKKKSLLNKKSTLKIKDKKKPGGRIIK